MTAVHYGSQDKPDYHSQPNSVSGRVVLAMLVMLVVASLEYPASVASRWRQDILSLGMDDAPISQLDRSLKGS
ncbi:hypothetical protein BDW75DRAFT_209316 [Aspergillus navahoensis]